MPNFRPRWSPCSTIARHVIGPAQQVCGVARRPRPEQSTDGLAAHGVSPSGDVDVLLDHETVAETRCRGSPVCPDLPLRFRPRAKSGPTTSAAMPRWCFSRARNSCAFQGGEFACEGLNHADVDAQSGRDLQALRRRGEQVAAAASGRSTFSGCGSNVTRAVGASGMALSRLRPRWRAGPGGRGGRRRSCRWSARWGR